LHAIADLGLQALCGAGAEDHLIADRIELRQVQLRIAGFGGDDFRAFDEALHADQQVGLSVERAGLAEGKTGFRTLAQTLDPGTVIVAVAEHLHLEVAWVAQQFILQLADHPVLEAKQQQQRCNHRHQRRSDAQRDLAVMPEVLQRQCAQQAQAVSPLVQTVSLPDG